MFRGYACTADVINYDATIYLTGRIAHVNKHGYDLAIEIQLNASGGTGSEVYYKHKSATGKNLAGAISKSIENTFGITEGRMDCPACEAGQTPKRPDTRKQEA